MRASSSLATVIALGLFVAGAACGSSQLAATGGTGGGETGSSSHAAGSGGASSSSSSSGASSSSSSSSSAATSSSGIVGDAGPVTGFPFPPVTYQGGTLIAAPKVVTLTFPGDALATQFGQIGASLTSSTYWDTVRAGYCGNGVCIGDGPAGTAVALTAAPAHTYTDSTQGKPATIQTFIAGLITAGEVPAPDANTIYALYVPASTTVTLDGSKSCQDFDGYHNSLMMGGKEVFYAIINECAAPQMAPPITLLQNTTITTSHEIIETASDGSSLNFSFYLDLNDQASFGWNDVQGGEIGDLCVDPFGLAQDETTEGGFTVQRIWSATNAAAGKNPCVPVPAGEVYFNAFSRVSAVVVGVGQSATIEVDALADGPMSAWTVIPQDWTDPSTQYLSFSIEGGTNTDAGPELQMQSGDKMQLTVTLLADPGNTVNGEADAVMVSANGNQQTATAAHWWPFIVLTPAEATAGGVTMMKRRTPPRKLSHGRGHGRFLHPLL